ncbi:hypothetical protein BEH94_01895 [Candidatus Altiarchaeales archaeon WOR_SM1_SCG]|nr:hypothetical protein BEH94_01895 [Candidatus Altiarchaeales archaeon WOR_SM1_SCG]
MDVNSIIIGAVAITLVVFIPGYCLTLALFAKKELDFVERSGISFILGLTTVFVLYALNKNLGVPIDTMTTYIVWILICLAGLGVWYKRKMESDASINK